MKRKTYILLSAALFVAASVCLSSCDKKDNGKEPEAENTALISFASYFNANGTTPGTATPNPGAVVPGTETTLPALYFGSKGGERFIVDIENTTEWTATTETEWIHAVKQADNTLLVTVDPSRSLFNRAGTVTVVAANPAQGTASFEVNQEHGTAKLYIRQLLGGINARQLSPNGRYAMGTKGSTAIVVEIDKLSDENYFGTEVAIDGAQSIDNNGVPHNWGCNADGTIYTDYAMIPPVDNGVDQEYWPSLYVPYIMRNNRRIDLSTPSTYSTMNIDIGGYMPMHPYKGCLPDLMSADGKYILGRIQITGMMWAAAKWERVGETNDYTFTDMGGDGGNSGALGSGLNIWQDALWQDTNNEAGGQTFLVIEPVKFLCPQNKTGLSPYGNYACGHYGSSLSGGGQPWRYNMETDNLEMFSGSNDIALYVTDDGTLFTTSSVYEPGSSSPISFNSWISKMYGSTVANQTMGSIGTVSSDYGVMTAFAVGDTYSYFIVVEP